MSSGSLREANDSALSMVQRALSSEPGLARIALTEFIERFSEAMVSYLRFKFSLNEHDVADIVQEFITERVLVGHFLSSFDCRRGRFRNYLFTVLNRFTVDWLRRARRNVERGDLDPNEVPEEGRQIFDVTWARSILLRVLKNIRNECRRKNQEVLWNILHRYYLVPFKEQRATKEKSHEILAEELGLANAQQFRDRLSTVNRKLKSHLRAAVAEYVDGDEEKVETEVAELRRVLADAGNTPINFDADASVMHSDLWTSVSQADSIMLSKLFDGDDDRDSCEELLDREMARYASDLVLQFSRQARLGHLESAVYGGLTAGECLAHPEPVLGVLDSLRKIYRYRARVESGAIQDVDRVLYVAFHAATVVKHGVYNSKKSPEDTMKSWHSALRRPWLDPLVRSLIEKAIERGIDP